MSDQCKNCTLRGDIKACQAVECSHHESWYVSAVKEQLEADKAQLQRENAELKDSNDKQFMKIAGLQVELFNLYYFESCNHGAGHMEAKHYATKRVDELREEKSLNKLRADAINKMRADLEYNIMCEEHNSGVIEYLPVKTIDKYANSIEGGE